MPNMQLCNALLLLVVASVSTVLANPGAPGQCIGGQAAVGGAHLLVNNITEGSLAEGGMAVSVNGQAIAAGTALTLPVGVEHTVTLDVTGGNPAVTFFRGFLIRLGSTDVRTLNTLQPVDTSISRVASLCIFADGGVGGVGHNSNVEKTTASVTMMLSSPAANMPLDVTAVVMLRNGMSEYYYSNYTVSVQDGATAPVTTAPVTMAPVTMAPVTAAPITPAPITAAPVTMAPITPAPVTAAPVTMAPITAAPVAGKKGKKGKMEKKEKKGGKKEKKDKKMGKEKGDKKGKKDKTMDPDEEEEEEEEEDKKRNKRLGKKTKKDD